MKDSYHTESKNEKALKALHSYFSNQTTTPKNMKKDLIVSIEQGKDRLFGSTLATPGP